MVQPPSVFVLTISVPQQDWDPALKQLVVKPARSMNGGGIVTAYGAEAAAIAAGALLSLQQRETSSGSDQSVSGGGVVIQPWMGSGAFEFSCLVVEGPGEPRCS